MELVYAYDAVFLDATAWFNDAPALQKVHERVRGLTQEPSLFQQKEAYLLLSLKHAAILPNVATVADLSTALLAINGEHDGERLEIMAGKQWLHAKLAFFQHGYEDAEIVPVRLLESFMARNPAFGHAVRTLAFRNPKAGTQLNFLKIPYIRPGQHPLHVNKAILMLRKRGLSAQEATTVAVNLRYLEPWELAEETFSQVKKNYPFTKETILSYAPALQRACVKETALALLRPHFRMRIHERDDATQSMLYALQTHRFSSLKAAKFAQAMQTLQYPYGQEGIYQEMQEIGHQRGAAR